ncbi:hypothetical protein Sru01_38110 [Sphaerisporangium rufum]|uniref:Uncharacterized protein n=1 Tax=Sphaerisporangium rufum TaxID=1381558 RepID=A0A919R3C6_9ACTN|nr:hypothetical protein [Sphaerisporangium rufum]GII78829.1 hypothetical protein Sru01_38110 [Sphaerisporangium rufum]
MLPIDPEADIARRAWVSCPWCRDDHGCADCGAGRNCGEHWRYLLAVTGAVLHLQCPGCTHLWSHPTGFGADGRPAAP